MTVEHWFDFICPYCYIAQDRNRILRAHRVELVEHALQIHPEIPPGGLPVGPRIGPSYDLLAREARAAGLPLRWTDRIPYSRPALAAFEWLRGEQPEVAERFAPAVFRSYFAEGLDIGSEDLLARLAEDSGGDPDELRSVLASGAAQEALARSLVRARELGVDSTPTWIAEDGRRISGLRPADWFEDWAG